MTQPSITVRDGNNSLKTIYTINPNGSTTSSNSQPVVIANDQYPLSLQPTRVILEAKRYASMSESVSIAIEGSGKSSFDVDVAETELSVGHNDQEPGRIYVSGTEFLNGGFSQYINGVNTPYHNWNEFGSTNQWYTYEPVWWEAEFARLQNRGVNASRVWLLDDCNNEGVVLDTDGYCQPPTELFWQHVDSLMTLAQTYKIYLMPTLMTFAHFDIYNGRENQSYRWHLMFGSEDRLQSFIDNYVIPLVVRYKDNPYLWAIDLGNEFDWLEVRADISTMSKSTCTVVRGSNILTFNKRLPDYIVGNTFALNSYTSGGGYHPDAQSSGPVLERLNDYQCRVTNTYTGTSETLYSLDQGYATHPVYYCEGYKDWRLIQRYVAKVSAAIHKNSSTLVCIGSGFIANSSDLYSGDKYKDADLMKFTSDESSKIDFHQIHWYAWMEPWFRLYKSPSANGLSEKPAVLGEVCANWAGMNIPDIGPWRKRMGASQGSYVWLDDNGTFRKYVAISGGTTDLYPPSGSGSHITDGTVVWKYQNSMWESNTSYNADKLIINTSGGDDPGRIYIVTTAGTTSGAGTGPQGTGTGILDGTVVWDYIREATTSEYDLFDYYKNNGWSGVMPWASNDLDNCLGLYEIDLSGLYPSNWQPSTQYSNNNMVVNNGRWYICVYQGTSNISPGPTGTGTNITDGTAKWNYYKDITMPPWTSTGISIKQFSDDNYDSIFPDISGQSWTNTGSSIRQSNSRAWYVPGSTMKVQQTFKFGTSAENLIQRVGLFDDNDGIFLDYRGSGSDLSIVVRANNEDYFFAQEDWNINTLSISGEPDYLDKTKLQTLIMDYNWLGGKNKVGFLVGNQINWAHEFSFGNSSNIKYPSNPSLPLRWEIVADGSVGDIGSLYTYHGFVLSSSDKERTKIISYGRGGSSKYLTKQTTVELIAVRLSTNKISTLRPKRISMLSTNGVTDYMFNWKLILNAPISSDGTWYSVNGSNCAEVTTGRTLSTGSATILAEGYARGDCNIELHDMPYLNMTADGTSDVLSLQVFGCNWYDTYIYATIEWEEII